MHICSFFISQAQTAELAHPRERMFHDPAPPSQAAAVFDIAHCKEWQDVAGTPSTTDVLRVVGPVPQYEIRRQRGQTAVMRLHDRDWIFRKEGPNRFRRVEVQATGATSDGMQEIRDGINADDQVVLNALNFSTAVAEKKE